MFRIPAAAEPLVEAFRGAFTRPTFQRFMLLMGALIVTMSRHTVSRALRAVEPMLEGHWSDYHRIWSSARFNMWTLGRILLREVVALLSPEEPIILISDDTVDGKNGDHVWAKAAHRDPTRSTRAHLSIRFGHKWLVLCVLVKLPGTNRPWALPVLCGMCRNRKVAHATGQRVKTASRITHQLLIRLMRWLPERKFILLGDSKAVSHRTACFASRHSDRVTVIGRLRADANLYAPPKSPGRRARLGRAKKGRKLPSPARQIASLPKRQDELAWYGSSRRTVTHVSDTALWYGKHTSQVVPIRWACVLGDKRLGLENAYFYSTHCTMSAAQIIESYPMRWNIEVTIEESRALLGLQTTRHWCRQSVLRVTPVLLGLFTVISLIWNRLPARRRETTCLLSQTPCYHKRAPTFADALYAVRRELWERSLLRPRPQDRCLTCLPIRLRSTLLWHLAAAA